MVVVATKVVFYLSVVLLLLQSALAEMMEEGKTKAKTVLNFYHQNSDNGNQVYDNSGREEANVFEPMIFITHQITEDTAIDFHGIFDLWTAASDTRIDGRTGASGEGIGAQNRGAGSIGVRREIGKWSYGAKAGFSTEYDYKSLNGSLDVSRSMANDNFVLGLGLQYYDDKIQIFKNLTTPENASLTEDLPRKILATNISLSQILTTKDLLIGNLTFSKATDTLESTASTVNINGLRDVEILPDSKSRYAISTKWIHGFENDTSMHLSYRYYFDQWDLSSHTFQYSHFWETNDEGDYLELFVRYHNQTAVKYYADSFDTRQVFMTSDSDLEDFSSYEIGLFKTHTYFDKKLLGINLEEWNFNYGAVYYTRDNGLRYGYLQTSFGVNF